MDERKQILCQCNHCGNKGNLDIRGRFCNRIDDYCDGQPCYWWQNEWFLLQCPVCGDAVLYEESTEEADYREDAKGDRDFNVNAKIAFPNPYLTLEHTPSSIKDAYESAVKCLSIDKNITLIAFRAVLERVAVDQNAQGRGLVSMIGDLVNKKIIPPTLKESMTIVRLLGNIGAHGEDFYASEHDLLAIKQFVEYIIDYIYEMPAKIQDLATKFNLESKVYDSQDPADDDTSEEKNYVEK